MTLQLPIEHCHDSHVSLLAYCDELYYQSSHFVIKLIILNLHKICLLSLTLYIDRNKNFIETLVAESLIGEYTMVMKWNEKFGSM